MEGREDGGRERKRIGFFSSRDRTSVHGQEEEGEKELSLLHLTPCHFRALVHSASTLRAQRKPKLLAPLSGVFLLRAPFNCSREGRRCWTNEDKWVGDESLSVSAI